MNLISYMIQLKVAVALNYELFQGEENDAKVVSSLEQQWSGTYEQKGVKFIMKLREVDLEMDSPFAGPLTALCSHTSFFSEVLKQKQNVVELCSS